MGIKLNPVFMTKLRINKYTVFFFKPNLWLFCFFAILFYACNTQQATETSEVSSEQDSDNEVTMSKAQQIIAEAIEAHGGDKYRQATIEFDFRDKHYKYMQNGAAYQYERIFKDSIDQKVRDVLTNDNFIREVAEKPVEVSEKWKGKYSNSVNSVMYFLMLPFRLEDPAVNTNYVGESKIKGEPYHKIKVTFGQEGGGKDYQDIFMYWFHQDKKTMDYLAYSYDVDGGGVRFREAINTREVEGILFQDYNNYKANLEDPLEDLDMLFEMDKLKMLSEIINENIKVKILQ